MHPRQRHDDRSAEASAGRSPPRISACSDPLPVLQRRPRAERTTTRQLDGVRRRLLGMGHGTVGRGEHADTSRRSGADVGEVGAHERGPTCRCSMCRSRSTAAGPGLPVRRRTRSFDSRPYLCRRRLLDLRRGPRSHPICARGWHTGGSSRGSRSRRVSRHRSGGGAWPHRSRADGFGMEAVMGCDAGCAVEAAWRGSAGAALTASSARRGNTHFRYKRL